MKVFLNGDHYNSPDELHCSLKRLLCLPEYYGGNADALYDSLEEKKELPQIVILSMGTGETEKALKKCCRVFEDLEML